MCTSQNRMPFILTQRTRCSVQPAYLLQFAGDPIFDALGLLLHLPGVQQSLHLLEQTMLWNIKPCYGILNHVLEQTLQEQSYTGLLCGRVCKH